LDLADYVNFLVEDAGTRIIACMVEGVRRPDAFMAAAEKALAARKPLLVLKLGRSAGGRAAAASHTGALAGDDQVFDAMCRHYGVLRCPTLDDLIEGCLALRQGRLPRGRRIGVAGFSGGAKGLLLDYAAEQRAELAAFAPETAAALRPRIDPGLPAENPLDVGATTGVQAQKFGEICRVVAGDPNVDIFLIQGQLPLTSEERYPVEPFREVLASTGKPVLAFGRTAQNVTEAGRAFQAKAGIPFIQGLPETLRATEAMIRYAEALGRGVKKPPVLAAGSPDSLGVAAFGAQLDAHGLTQPRSARASSPEAAAEAAAAVGFPVAFKLLSPDAIHKTEWGGVALGLRDRESILRAAAAMALHLEEAAPGARIEAWLVQEMVEGLELLAGVREDPQWGPVLVTGLGGVLVEVMDDVAFRLLPVDQAEAAEMLRSLKGAPLFGAFRGRRPRDLPAAALALAGLSRLFLEHRPFLADLEINPLIVLAKGEGVRAVDVRLVRR
ncbi:MAG: acetate--CoA ligase family protein, partial [Stellaceae bacterium]